MPTVPEPVTLSEVVHKAVEVCDDGTTNALDELLARFEDEDVPITAVGDVEERLDERVGPPDDGDPPPFTMARAVIVYLAYRRDEIGEDPERLLRLAARAEFDGHPPRDVAQWLTQRGVPV
jgi:hypothetical protein